MKMKASRPFLKGGAVILPGQEFTTLEQHGRELIQKNIAEAVKAEPAKEDKPAPKSRAKKAE